MRGARATAFFATQLREQCEERAFDATRTCDAREEVASLIVRVEEA